MKEAYNVETAEWPGKNRGGSVAGKPRVSKWDGLAGLEVGQSCRAEVDVEVAKKQLSNLYSWAKRRGWKVETTVREEGLFVRRVE